MRQKWTKHKLYGIKFGAKQAFSCGKMRHIWRSAPYMAHTHKRHIGYTPPQLSRRRFCITRKSDAPSRRGRHSGQRTRRTGYCWSRDWLRTGWSTRCRRRTRGADRGPVEAVVARVAQVVAWDDATAPDKHQRRLHNSIRISWGLGDEVGEATVCSGVAGREGEAFQKV